jgi:hypothetical protein
LKEAIMTKFPSLTISKASDPQKGITLTGEAIRGANYAYSLTNGVETITGTIVVDNTKQVNWPIALTPGTWDLTITPQDTKGTTHDYIGIYIQ